MISSFKASLPFDQAWSQEFINVRWNRTKRSDGKPEQRATAIGAMRRVECATATDGEVRPAALGPACREHALGSGAGHKKKNEAPRLAAVGSQASDHRRPALLSYRIFLSTYQIRCALRALNEAALLATIWNLRRATNIHGDIFVSKASLNLPSKQQSRIRVLQCAHSAHSTAESTQ